MKIRAGDRGSDAVYVRDLDTGKVLMDVQWADDVTGDYGQFEYGPFGPFVVPKHGNIKIEMLIDEDPEYTSMVVLRGTPRMVKEHFEGTVVQNGGTIPRTLDLLDPNGNHVLSSVLLPFEGKRIKVQMLIEVVG